MKLGALPLSTLAHASSSPAMTRLVAHAAAGLNEVGISMPVINPEMAAATLGISEATRTLLREIPTVDHGRER